MYERASLALIGAISPSCSFNVQSREIDLIKFTKRMKKNFKEGWNKIDLGQLEGRRRRSLRRLSLMIFCTHIKGSAALIWPRSLNQIHNRTDGRMDGKDLTIKLSSLKGHFLFSFEFQHS